MKRIQELRKKKGLSGEKLGAMVGVKKAAISKYELGQAQPSVEVLIQIANILNTSTDYLLGNTDDPTPPDIKKEAPSKKEARLLANYNKADSHVKKAIDTLLEPYDEPEIKIAARGNGGVSIIKGTEAERLIRADDELNEEGMILTAEGDKF